MATEVKRRRGTTVEHSTFTGAVAELTVDLTKDTVVVHDGATQGGFPLLREDLSNVPTTAPFTHITLDTAIFDTTYSETGSETQGTLYWNQDEETLSLVTNGETIELGQKVEVHVKNQTGAQINKGEVVYASGTVGASGRILVTKMIADGTIAAKRILGVAAENIANGADGKVVKFGKIRQIDTTAFDEGDILWVSTTVAGAFQNTEPSQSAGDIALPIAFVVTDSVNVGEIFIRVTPIDENEYQDYDAGLADIAGLTPTDSNFIVGNGTNWVAESGDTARLSLGVGSTDSPTFGGLTVNGSITVTGNVDGRDVAGDGANLDELYTTIGLSALTTDEVNQLENIGSTTISATQWGYLGALDQNLRTTDAVTFATVDTGQGANELYAMNQDVKTTDDVTFNVVNVSDSITDASTTYSAGIIGAGTIYDMDDGNGSFFEVDNMRVRNELRAHIFKKDIVKASNAYLFITDSAEIATTTTITDDTSTFRVVEDGTNASFNHQDLLWAKNLQDDGSLQVTGVKLNVMVQPQFVWDKSTQEWDNNTSIPFTGYTEFTSGTDATSGKNFTEYNVYAVESAGTLNAGDTIVRVSGGNILNDASSSQSPFIDIYDGVTEWSQFQDVSKTKVRLGNLAGVSNASGFGLFTENAFLTGSLVVGDLTKAGNYLEYNGSALNVVTGTFNLATPTLVIDSANNKIALGASASAITIDGNEVGFIADGNGEFKAYADANNYIRLANSALDIKAESFDLDATDLDITNSNGGLIQIAHDTTTIPIKFGKTNVGSAPNYDGKYGLEIGSNNYWKVVDGFTTAADYVEFRVGTGTNFIDFDGTNIDIDVDTFDLTAGSMTIDSTNGITIGANDFFKQDKTFSFGGGLLSGTATTLSISGAGATIDVGTFDLEAGDLSINSADRQIQIADSTTRKVTINDDTTFTTIQTLGTGTGTVEIDDLDISDNTVEDTTPVVNVSTYKGDRIDYEVTIDYTETAVGTANTLVGVSLELAEEGGIADYVEETFKFHRFTSTGAGSVTLSGSFKTQTNDLNPASGFGYRLRFYANEGGQREGNLDFDYSITIYNQETQINKGGFISQSSPTNFISDEKIAGSFELDLPIVTGLTFTDLYPYRGQLVKYQEVSDVTGTNPVTNGSVTIKPYQIIQLDFTEV